MVVAALPALLLLSSLWAAIGEVAIPPSVVELKEDDMLDGLNSVLAKGTWVVFWYSPTCPACAQYEPMYKSIAEDVMADVRFAKIAIEGASIAAASYNVKATPTLICFRDGRYKGTLSNYMDSDALLLGIQEATDRTHEVFFNSSDVTQWQTTAPPAAPPTGCASCRANQLPSVPTARYILLDRTTADPADVFTEVAKKLFRKDSLEFGVVEQAALEELGEHHSVSDGTAKVVALHHSKSGPFAPLAPIPKLAWPFTSRSLTDFILKSRFPPMIEYYPDNQAQYLEVAEAGRPFAIAIIEPTDPVHRNFAKDFGGLSAEYDNKLSFVWVDATMTHKRYFMMLGITRQDLPCFVVTHNGKMATDTMGMRELDGIRQVLTSVVQRKAVTRSLSLPSMADFAKWEKGKWDTPTHTEL